MKAPSMFLMIGVLYLVCLIARAIDVYIQGSFK